MEAHNLWSFAREKWKKIQNFLMLINIGPQLELSDSLLLELMNPHYHPPQGPALQKERGTLWMGYTDVCQQEEIRSLGHLGFSLMVKQTCWHYGATSLPFPDPFQVCLLNLCVRHSFCISWAFGSQIHRSGRLVLISASNWGTASGMLLPVRLSLPSFTHSFFIQGNAP